MRWIAIAGAAVLWTGSASWCQIPSPDEADGKPPPLSALLPRLDWDPDARGVLIVIAPERAKPHTSALIGPRVHLLALERIFDRKATTAGRVTVFAPKTMDVLNWQRLPEPSATAGLTRGAKLALWEASLTPAQWKLYASPQGIGASDLDRDQAVLFRESLPDRAELRQPVARADGSATLGPPTPLDSSQTGRLRRTISRQLAWTFPVSDGSRIALGGEPPTAILIVPFRSAGPEDSIPGDFYGQNFRETVPNRLKRSDIDYDSAGLGRMVDLTDALDVGTLVARCSMAARVEIRCDPRYAELPVVIRGRTARAGDLLRAVARGVTGTYRRIGDAYVLTDDLVPLGTRLAAITDWIGQTRTLTTSLLDAAKAKTGDSAWEFSGWGDGPDRPNDALARKLTEYRKRWYEPYSEADIADPSRRFLQVPVSELPRSAQETVARQTRQTVAFENGETYRKDVVVPQEQLRRGFFLPGVGPVDDQATSLANVNDAPAAVASDSDTVPPIVPLPRGRKATHLSLELATPAQAVSAVGLAAKAGFTSLWIATPGDDPRLYDAAASAGARAGLPVYAVVRPARARSASDDIDPTIALESPVVWAERQWEMGADRAITDRSGIIRRQVAADILHRGAFTRIDRPSDRQRLVDAVASVARIGSLAGVVVEDWAPPTHVQPAWELIRTSAWSSFPGYSPEMRLACLRNAGFDPADLPPPFGLTSLRVTELERGTPTSSLELPWFPSSRSRVLETMSRQWRDVRAQAGLGALLELHRLTVPVPILFAMTSPYGDWLGSLDRAQPGLPPAGLGDEPLMQWIAGEQRRTSTRIVETVALSETVADRRSLARVVGRWIADVQKDRNPPPDERVYALTSLLPEDQLWTLERLKLTAIASETSQQETTQR